MVSNKGMQSWKDDLVTKQIAQVASYVKSCMAPTLPIRKHHRVNCMKEETAVAASRQKPATDTADTSK